MMTEAMAPVTTKVAMVTPMIFPARARLFMLAMAPATEQNTSGTTMQNSRLIKIVPRGSSAVAPGQAQPTAHPAAMAPSMAIKST